MGKTINLTCAQCGVEFQKARSEYNRQVKRGRDYFFCKQTCATVHGNNKHEEECKLLGKDPYEHAKKNIKPWMGNAKNQSAKDDLTPFRWFILRAEYRGKRNSRKECKITAGYLKQLFEEQKNTCPFTGWELTLPNNNSSGWPDGSHYKNASLDRVDNSKGYIEGNVRFVCLIANMARQTYGDDAVIEFCRAVVNHQT